MMKKLLSLAMALAMVLSLTACGGGGGDAGAGGDAGSGSGAGSGNVASSDDPNTLKIIQNFDPGTFQPSNNDEQGYNRIVRQIYETLFMFDENGELQPWLAESYEWDDSTHLRLHIRDGVKFSNGADFGARDVVATIKYVLDEALPTSHFLVVDLDETSVVDELTCVIGLKYPQTTFPNHLANDEAVIASADILEGGNLDWLGDSVVGTGPYKLVSYTPGDMITMTANEYYWREGEPKVPNLEMRVVSSSEAASNEAKTLNYDIVTNANINDYAGIDAVDGISMHYGLAASTTYLLLNTQKAPMDDVRVREAFSRAINTQATVKLVYGDFGEPASGMVCPDIGGRNETTYQKYYGAGSDIEAAKFLLAEAGYADGIELEITVPAPDTQRCDMAEAMQAQVAEAGITLKVNKMEDAPMREYMANGQHQMCIYGFTSLTMEADGFLAQLQPGSSALARIGYDRQEFFDTYERGCSIENAEERYKVWEECLEMLMEDYTMIPLWHKALGAAVKDNLDGFWWAKDYEEIYYQFISKS